MLIRNQSHTRTLYEPLREQDQHYELPISCFLEMHLILSIERHMKY